MEMSGFDVISRLETYKVVDLTRLPLHSAVAALPIWRRIMLEGLLRRIGIDGTNADHVCDALRPCTDEPFETHFSPARIVMQDYSGTAALVDLAALRTTLAQSGGNPSDAVPRVPVDLVVDHSLVLNETGPNALKQNHDAELAANAERYSFLEWAEQNVEGLRVVPPGQGIIHQLNMERFTQPVQINDGWLMPDTVLGTDSHTTMINGLGILGWGVGGIEAMAAMMGTPLSFRMPRSLSLWLTGERRPEVQAADIALALTERLRAFGVVGSVIEVRGPGAASLSVEDRATIANMCPEYGATACLFPIDDASLEYLRAQGRAPDLVALGRRYLRRNGLMADQSEMAAYNDRIDFDLSTCTLCAAGPFRPDQKCDLTRLGAAFQICFPQPAETSTTLADGDIVLAAITSCTNTANPDAMIAAGLVARAAQQYGLSVSSHIKTTMALGSQQGAEDLRRLGLLEDLEALGFYVDGFGCGACVGNAGRLAPNIEREITQGTTKAVAVLSGNRNFPGRIHPCIQANFLMSPAAVIVLALAGHVRGNLAEEPVAQNADGQDVLLTDLWPTAKDIAALRQSLEQHSHLKAPNSANQKSKAASNTAMFAWDAQSSYLIRPPFFDLPVPHDEAHVLSAAVPLLMLGDAITTDHISPVGSINLNSDSGQYLQRLGVPPEDFNTYGARRGNHEVMIRGTFANPKLKNRLVDVTGPWTKVHGTSDICSVFEASRIHGSAGRQLVVIAGKRYGAGSARDWAAKGTRLLGIRAVIAEGFERIHRSNLICAGVLPIEIPDSKTIPHAPNVSIDLPIAFKELRPGAPVTLRVHLPGSAATEISGKLRLDTIQDVDIFRAGGLMPKILGRLRLPDRGQGPVDNSVIQLDNA